MSQTGTFFCCDIFWLCCMGSLWWQGRNPQFCPKHRSASWKFTLCLNMVFSRQSLIGACQNLGGCAALKCIPNKPARKYALALPQSLCFACSDFTRQDLESTLVESYVQGQEHVLLGSLKRWLPMNHADLPEPRDHIWGDIAQKTTELPTICQASTILKFFTETTTIQ